MFFIGWEKQYGENGRSYGQLVIGSVTMRTSLFLYHVLSRVFLAEISNHPGDSAPLQPIFGALQLLTFPQN